MKTKKNNGWLWFFVITAIAMTFAVCADRSNNEEYQEQYAGQAEKLQPGIDEWKEVGMLKEFDPDRGIAYVHLDYWNYAEFWPGYWDMFAKELSEYRIAWKRHPNNYDIRFVDERTGTLLARYDKYDGVVKEGQ